MVSNFFNRFFVSACFSSLICFSGVSSEKLSNLVENTEVWKNISFAIKNDNTDLLKESLNNTKRNIDFNDLADVAIENNSFECLRYLLENSDVKVSSTNIDGQNFLHKGAINKSLLESLGVLISKSENNDFIAKDKYEKTPIHVAYENWNFYGGDMMREKVGEFPEIDSFRSKNKISQIFGVVLAGAIFATMIGAVIYDSFEE